MVQSTSSWLERLSKDGYVVIPNVIPEEACDQFQDAALSWLEAFPYGFKRDDKATWAAEHCRTPQRMQCCCGDTVLIDCRGGLYNRYSVNHESFVWAVRE